jgi:ankyrin repeat protein
MMEDTFTLTLEECRSELSDRILYFAGLGVVVEEDVESFLRIIKLYPDELCKQFYNVYRKQLLLHVAAEYLAPDEVLKAIISYNPAAIEMRDIAGRTPLHTMCQVRCSTAHVDTYKLLASPNVLCAHNEMDNNNSLLHAYLEDNHVPDLRVVQFLAESFPECIKELNDDGKAPIHLVCEDDAMLEHLDILRYFVEVCPESCNLRNSDGETPLHVCCRHKGYIHGLLAVIKFLVESNPDNVQAIDNAGRTPLHSLCLNVCYDATIEVLFLASAYFDALKMEDLFGSTPFDLVCRSRYAEVELIETLKILCPAVLEPESGGRTPLHTFCETHTSRLCYREMVFLHSLLISEKAITAKDQHGQTPFHLLSRGGSDRDTMQMVFDKCHDVINITDNNGCIPLHVAVEASSSTDKDFSDTINFLLEKFPCGIMARNNNGMTPLQLACQKDAPLSIIYNLIRMDPVSSIHGLLDVEHYD